MTQCGVWLAMHRNAGLLTTICILLCFAANYTFPLNRDFKWPKISFGRNNTHSCEPLDHIGTSIVDRTKKMTTNIEDVMKKVNASAQEVYHSAMENKRLSDEDLRQYEQLVIMKKYPYLDLKELEYKYNSAGKNIRQSFKDEPSGINVDTHDPGLCEPPDNINVEVFNRGLSGFTIPKKFIKGLSTITKVKENDLKAIQEKIEQNKDSKSHDDLRSLRHYIEAYLL